jgi:hypothetical protein
MSRQTLITFQPSEFVDHITEDGTELTKLPYPVHAWADTGRIPHDAGGTSGRRIVGFQRDLQRQQIDLSWATVAYHPPDAVGTYAVIEGNDGKLFSLTTAIRDVQTRVTERPDTIAGPLQSAPDSDHRKQGWS